MNADDHLKLLGTAGVCCLAVALTFVAADPSASAYELSVYDGYPLAFWVLLLAALVLGQIVVVESVGPDGCHRYWKFGFALVVGVNCVLLFLPALRYFLYAKGDMLTFAGMIRDVETLGFVPETNYYPNVHLLGLAFAYATGIDTAKVVDVLPPVFSLLYVLALYLLSTTLFSDRRTVLFVIPFGALLVYKFENLLFTASVFAFMLVPLVFYLLFRADAGRTGYRFKLPFVTAVVALVFYHPAVTVFVAGTFVLLKLTSIAGRRVAAGASARKRTPLVAATVAFVIFLSWYYSFRSIAWSTILVLYNLLGISEAPSTFSTTAGVFARVDPQLSDVLLVGFYKYGLSGAILSVGLVFVSYFAYLFARGRRDVDGVELFLVATFFAFTAGAVLAFFVDVTLGFNRFVRYVKLSGTILIGLGFYTLYRRVGGRFRTRYLRPVLYASLFVLAFLSVFMLYGSTLSNDHNLQVTESSVDGMEWLFEHRNDSLLIDDLGLWQFRYYTYMYGRTELEPTIRRGSPPPPAHFDYANASTSRGWFRTAPPERYLVVDTLGRIENPRFYPQYPEFWQHTPRDFRGLDADRSVAHVYTDGDLDVYVVDGIGSGNRTERSSDPG